MKPRFDLSPILILLVALPSIGVGVVSLFAPEFVAATVGFAFETPLGRSEIMTFYGGFYLGLGLFMLLGVFRPKLRYPLAIAMLFTAIPSVLARTASILVLRISDGTVFLLLGAELAYLAVGLALFLISRSKGPQGE